MIRILISFGFVASIGLGSAGCGDNSEDCGPGTVEIDGECVVAGFDCGPGTTEVDGVCVDDGPECGDGTIEQDGECVDDGPECGDGTVEQDGECVVPPPGPGVPVISATLLDFGLTDCGDGALPRAFVISNQGGETFTFDITLAAGAASPYVVSPDTGIVGPLGQVTVLVFSDPIPQTSAVTPNLYGDMLTVTTDVAGDSPHTVALQQTAQGVILATTTPVLDFPGLQAVGTGPLTGDVTIQNLGNVSTDVTLISSDSSFSPPAGATSIAAGASAPITVSYVPFESGSIEAALQLSATGTSCGGAPPPIDASGTGTFAGTAEDILLVPPIRQRSHNINTLCARLTSGHVACLGGNQVNARGAGVGVVTAFATPTVVRAADGTPLDQVVEIGAGHAQVCARRTDGSVFCWGNVANERSVDSPVGQPFASLTFEGAIGLAPGYGFMCVVLAADGSLSCTGQPPQRASNVQISSWTVTGATTVGLNGGGGYALQADGTVLSFGVAEAGARGNADVSNSPPSLVANVTDVASISAHTKRVRNSRPGGACAVHTGGTVSCWGEGRHGMNGDGTTNDTAAAVQVQTAAATPLTAVAKMASGRDHRCAIATDGVYCWGRGSEGQLGRATDRNNPFAALTEPVITDAVTIATAARGSCVVRTNHAVTCWGSTPFAGGAAHVNLAAFEPLP